MPRPLPFLVLLTACAGDLITDTVVGDGTDTSAPVCGRVRGTNGVLLYQDDGTTVRAPVDPPTEATRGTGVTGPLDASGLVWAAVVNGRVFTTQDAGCNWTGVGSLPGTGDWALRGATTADDTRLLAIDRASSAVGWSTDLGVSWTNGDAGGTFVGVPEIDATDPLHVVGVQGRGVVESTDGGATWQVVGGLPVEGTQVYGADVDGANPAGLMVGGAGGAWTTTNSGADWNQVLDLQNTRAVAMGGEGQMWAVARGTDGLLGIWSTDGSTADTAGTLPDWQRVLDEAIAPISEQARLWPLPDDADRALSSFGPTTNSAGEPAVNLYLLEAGAGSRTVRVGTFTGIQDVAFGADRWFAAVR